jgi:hypothetical protein
MRNDLDQIKLAQLPNPHGEVWQVTEPSRETAKCLKPLELKDHPDCTPDLITNIHAFSNRLLPLLRWETGAFHGVLGLDARGQGQPPPCTTSGMTLLAFPVPVRRRCQPAFATPPAHQCLVWRRGARCTPGRRPSPTIGRTGRPDAPRHGSSAHRGCSPRRWAPGERARMVLTARRTALVPLGPVELVGGATHGACGRGGAHGSWPSGPGRSRGGGPCRVPPRGRGLPARPGLVVGEPGEGPSATARGGHRDGRPLPWVRLGEGTAAWDDPPPPRPPRPRRRPRVHGPPRASPPRGRGAPCPAPPPPRGRVGRQDPRPGGRPGPRPRGPPWGGPGGGSRGVQAGWHRAPS